MTTLKHPTIPGYEVEVPTARVKDWKASGWLDPRAKGPEVDEPTKTPAGDDG